MPGIRGKTVEDLGYAPNMRTAWALGFLVISLAPAIARAEEPDPSVKIGRLEEIGVVLAGVGGSALLSGTILLGMGLDRRLPPGETADEVYIATAMIISGAVLLGTGIPIAFIGKAKRNEQEKKEREEKEKKPAAMLVPTLGGAVLTLVF